VERSVTFGYRAVAEQYSAAQLLEFAVDADEQGFEFVSISDHFHPWFHEGGHAVFAWTWMPAALERTKNVRIGTGVTTPINRYHPAIIAQAFATMAAMHPGRVYLGLGTGEAMNEVPVGQRWPDFKERIARVEESIKIIRMLWSNDFTSYRGKYYSLTDAKLYIDGYGDIPIYVAASGPAMAELAGMQADGLYTTPAPPDHLRNVLLPAFRKGAEKNGRDHDKLNALIFCNISWDEDYDRALKSILRWRVVAIPGMFGKPVWDPRKLDELGKTVPVEEIAKRWIICTNLEDAVKRIDEYASLGFNQIEIRSGSPDEKKFIKKFGRELLPYLKDRYGKRGQI
jgi:coenzyme F420-dependent glucose-6-phosphate dehydrogenase